MVSQRRPAGSTPLVKVCSCPPGRRPERTRAHVYRELVQLVIAFPIPDDMPLFSLKCPRCNVIMVVSAKDIRSAA